MGSCCSRVQRSPSTSNLSIQLYQTLSKRLQLSGCDARFNLYPRHPVCSPSLHQRSTPATYLFRAYGTMGLVYIRQGFLDGGHFILGSREEDLSK